MAGRPIPPHAAASSIRDLSLAGRWRGDAVGLERLLEGERLWRRPVCASIASMNDRSGSLSSGATARATFSWARWASGMYRSYVAP